MNTNHKAVVFDMDDVIVNLREQVYRLFLKEHGNHIPDISDWYTYNVTKLFDISSKEEAFELFQKYKVLENARPENYAFDLIRNYIHNDYRIFMVTSRGWHPHGTVVTEQWLKDYNLLEHIDNFYVTGMDECKSEVLSMLNGNGFEIDYLYEDQMCNIEPCVNAGVVNKAYLINRPWNQDAKDKYKDLFDSGKVEYHNGITE